MEIILLLILIILFFVLKSSISDVSHNQKNILYVLQQLQQELQQAKETIKQLKQNSTTTKEPPAEKASFSKNILFEQELQSEKISTSKVEEKKTETPEIATNRIQILNEITDGKNELNYNDTLINEANNKQTFWEKFVTKNPDVEKFIGENLINKIGIAVFVLGIAFFIKYAIDKNWINEIGRVAIGIFCGGLLISIAHYLRATYRSFSSVLVGGGLTVLYFSIGFAFQQYQLFSQSIAFALVCLITILAVLLCIFYDRIELAIIATIGGFVTPFIVSTGSGNYVVLFTYLTVLNIGLIALAYYKNWRIVQYIAFVITSIIYCTWLYNRISLNQTPIFGALLFATIFYILFVAMNLLHHVIKKQPLKATDFTLLLSINACFFACGLSILDQINHPNYKGLFTAILALFNGVIIWWIYKKYNTNKNLLHLFIGLTTTYISLIAPIHFDGVSIVLFWCAEMVVIFWLYQKTNIRLLKIATLILECIVIISLIYNLNGYDSFIKTALVFLNKQFITYCFAGISFLAFYRLLKTEANTYFEFGITTEIIKNIAIIIATILFFIAGFAEINYQVSSRIDISNASLVCLNTFVSTFSICLYLVYNKTAIASKNLTFAITISGVLLFKLFTWFLIFNNLETSIVTHQAQWQLIVFFISELLVYTLFTICIKKFNVLNNKNSTKNYTLFYTITLVLNISSSISIIYLLATQPNANNVVHYKEIYNRAGLSILWGILSFIAMWRGMKWSNKTLRIFALILFGITLVKLAIVDIQKMNEAGKIIAFILIGAILLIVSFMYQRLKKLINNENELS